MIVTDIRGGSFRAVVEVVVVKKVYVRYLVS